MQAKASAQDFEAAASIRDQITALSRMSVQPDEYSSKNELQLLAKSLSLKNIPARIEGFDISNISGTGATGSMVSFYHGQPDKNNYRRFRIKAVSGVDDYKMLAEVLFRRYNRLLQEKKTLPDLLLIDGGKGHLQVAARVLAGLGLDIPLVSIAKPRNKTCGFKWGKEAEHIYSSTSGVGRLVLIKEGAALNLIRRIRDEAHRFALGYHHLLHKKEIYKKC
jgi:excinuclease ABC subunit C